MIQNTLSQLIKKEYVKSIIYPLLLIEAMLLWAYFGSNAYVSETNKNVLIEETKVHIKEISKRSATIINTEFKTISDITSLFQKEHENFFASYNPLHVNTKGAYFLPLWTTHNLLASPYQRFDTIIIDFFHNPLEQEL